MTTQPHTMPVTLTVGDHSAQVGQLSGDAETWRENLAGLLRRIADEFNTATPQQIRKIAYYVPTALGTCESCGHPVRYNLTVDYVEHVEPQTSCGNPFPAVARDQTEEKPQ